MKKKKAASISLFLKMVGFRLSPYFSLLPAACSLEIDTVVIPVMAACEANRCCAATAAAAVEVTPIESR